MPTIARTDSSDPDFATLVAELDAELWERYPALQGGYDTLNRVPTNARVVLAHEGGESLGCGCIKETGEAGTVELKRMFVRKSARGRGISKALVLELEAWAGESGVLRMILETGVKQPEAIGLYERMGFARIENYGEYRGDGNSVCMAKALGGRAPGRELRMRAIICPKYGPAEVLRIEEREKPGPRDDEILINIRAASVTNSDLFIRSSKVDPKLLLPFRLMIGIRRPWNEIIGEVLAGTVEAVGPKIRRFEVGDRVYGLTGMSLGAYADYKCMREADSKRGCVARMPEGIGFEEATGAAYGGLLALQALEKGDIARRKRALIYGASGTSGTMAVQIARTFGSEVTAVCGAAKAEFIRALGARTVLDYADDTSIAKLERYDLVVDAVGVARKSPLKEACKRALAEGGAYVSIDGEALVCDSARLERVTRLVAERGLRPVTDRVFDFSQIVEAHRYVELGHKLGNVAIRVNP